MATDDEKRIFLKARFWWRVVEPAEPERWVALLAPASGSMTLDEAYNHVSGLRKESDVRRDPDKVVWKYGLPVEDRTTINMPKGSRVLDVGVQDERPVLWALVPDVGAPIVRRVFFVVGTGHPMPGGAGRYVGTFQ